MFPVSGGFIRLAGHFVDDALGFMSGWNFYLYEALLIPFEITALTTILGFWRTDIPAWSVPIACIILYGLINILAVRAYGEAEFWLSGGKVVLIFLLFCFTFVTMVGGNPHHFAYGFYYWQNPGSFAEYRTTGSLGRLEGFLAALWNASFCVVGPEYISMVAAEAKRPRVYIKAAFKTVYVRFAIFFIGGALATGIVVAYNDPTLVDIVSGEGTGGGTASASPYVIAMVCCLKSTAAAVTAMRPRADLICFVEKFGDRKSPASRKCLVGYVNLLRWQHLHLREYTIAIWLGSRRSRTKSPPLLHKERSPHRLLRRHHGFPLPLVPISEQRLCLGSPMVS